MPQVQICRGFGHKDWQALSLRLIKSEAIQPGEHDWQRTLQFFRSATSLSTRQAFVTFLTECLGFERAEAELFENGIRNGILHQTKTREWIIRRDSPENRIIACEAKPYMLNRTLFCNELRTWFKSYIGELRQRDANVLRRNFINGMKHIVERC